MSASRLARGLATAREALLAARRPEGYWEGRLSSSALSTALAAAALAGGGRPADRSLAQAAVRWLARTQTAEGGWGDTPDSPPNLSTTLVTAAALDLVGETAPAPEARARAEGWLCRHAGSDTASRVAAVRRIYGADRTFAVPILTTLALAGQVPWEQVPPLPWALAALPGRLHRLLRLQVVSYALPALIAVGLAGEAFRPGAGPLRRARRGLLSPLVLGKLAALQPSSGGFLEAAPLTAFVALSLLPLHGPHHPPVARGLQFLRDTARSDGSWPIDTNLSVWVTTGAVSALAASDPLTGDEACAVRTWLVERQFRAVHPFTGAAPGGWGWSHRPGAAPDVDDTCGALLALASLGEREALHSGVRWLLSLQNADGGWPTFCRGWGKLPFDRSSPDLTAHALRALRVAEPRGRPAVRRALARGRACLRREQQPDGSWHPLWFGNQAAPGHANPVFGAARVLRALGPEAGGDPTAEAGLAFLLGAQHPSGGWGGAPGVQPSVEETALALAALCPWAGRPQVAQAAGRGLGWLLARVEEGSFTRPEPIGLYFASLWYSEDLYPLLWTTEALGLAARANLDPL